MKTFTVGTTGPALEFELVGTDLHGHPYRATFRCLPEISVAAVQEISSATDSGAGTKVLVPFLERCLVADDIERFREVVHGSTVFITMNVLSDIALWLVEEYAGRPTSASSGSLDGSMPTTPMSMDSAGSEGFPTPETLVSNGSAMSSTP